jgi:coenzyme F420 hydrogenase subunit beta
MKGEEFVLPAQRRMEIKQFFTPARCRICFDKMNIFSDITVGDPHGIVGVDRTRGESVVLVRNQKGAELISAALSAGLIYLRSVEPQEVFLGQQVESKKQKWSSSLLAWKKRFSMYPDFGNIRPESTVVSCKKEIQELICSLNLDKFVNRSRIISHYKRVLIFKKMVHLPKRSYFLLCKIINRLKTITHGGACC